jgi:hypothetical protein
VLSSRGQRRLPVLVRTRYRTVGDIGVTRSAAPIGSYVHTVLAVLTALQVGDERWALGRRGSGGEGLCDLRECCGVGRLERVGIGHRCHDIQELVESTDNRW